MHALGLIGAIAALALAGPGTRTYTTGQFVVNCTSTGQVCKPAKQLTLTPPRRGTVTSVRYSTPPTHCSALALQVVRNGKVLATSKRLEAGVRTVTFNPRIAVHAGRSSLGFRAKGFVGGCNSGRVGSWGGNVTVTVTLR